MKKIIFNTLILSIVFSSVFAQTKDVFDLSLEELMNMDVTSVSKKAESLQKVPSSIYVITQEDISESGQSSVLELLRDYVPGFWSASIDYMRGDSYVRNSIASSVLVLLDGTPMQNIMDAEMDYSNFDIPLNEIERIEIIRGSGGTIYGANSATGVINIFTKKAGEGKKFYAELKTGLPTLSNVNLAYRLNPSEKFSASIYGKFKYFSGFKQIESVEESNPTVPSLLNEGETTTIVNKYTKDDKTTMNTVLGARIAFQANGKLKLSANLHFNKIDRDIYNIDYREKNSYLDILATGPQPRNNSEVNFVSDNKARFVGNLKLDYNLSDNHNLFARVSTNYEDSHEIIGSSYSSKTSTVDIEIQDNFTLAYNEISVGGNYRMLHYNIYDNYNDQSVAYVDPLNNENLKGFFIQDKISLLDEKLNFYFGMKAENFSLIDDKFYFSPTAKLVATPFDKFTLWGGYSKSFTTPGYTQTNIELTVFSMNSQDFYSEVVPLVVYQQVYEQAIAGGSDAATANSAAQDYLTSTDGQNAIAEGIAGGMAQYPNNYNVAAINGDRIVPSSLTNYEIGLRFQPTEKIYFETTFFKTFIEDGVINSPTSFSPTPSLTKEGENIEPYYYGNYLSGNNTGIETVFKFFPNQDLNIELSHSWFLYDIEYQENEQFDINSLSTNQKDLVNEEYPSIPTHLFRARVSYNLLADLRLSVSGLYSTAFYNKFGTIDALYEYELQRFDPIFGDRDYQHEKVGKNEDRLILNFKINKKFINEKLNLYLYANDVLSTPYIESVDQLLTVYPRQIGRVFGFGLSYSIQ